MTQTRAGTSRPGATSAGGRDNSFDGLRLVGALAVIFGHAFLLTGRSKGHPELFGYPVETVGVIVFFSISGYLITASWQRNSTWRAFLVARCLRIFPALFVVVIVAAVVIGPAATDLSLREYVHRRDAWTYLGNAVLRFQQPLPEVWDRLPDRGVNGPLWTLPIEFVCYVAVPATMLVVRRWRPVAVLLLLTAAVTVSFSPELSRISIWNTYLGGVATMAPFFVAGAVLRIWHERGHVFRSWLAVCLVLVHVALVELVPGSQWHVGWLTLPYAVLTLGLTSVPVLRDAARWGDLSYGLYLWGWPVQQVVVQLLGPLPAWQNLPVVLAVTGLLAAASWRVIESPALALKDRVGSGSRPCRLLSGRR